MRPIVFSAVPLRQFLRRNRIATLPQLKQLLGTEADITFRKLKELSYRTSYSHRGSFEPLLRLAEQDRIARQTVSGLYLYCASNSRTRQRQLRARQELLERAAAVADSSTDVSDELRAAIVLFASVLDERQRRLYAGLESLQLGGDRKIAELLHLDPHTVAKGRRQLLAQDVEADRVRAVGGGRKPMGKKRPP